MRRSVDRNVLPSGETRWLEWSNRAIFDGDGKLEGYLSVARKTLFRDEAGRVIGLIGRGRDVTEQVRAQRALAASGARFAAFAENAPVAMF